MTAVRLPRLTRSTTPVLPTPAASAPLPPMAPSPLRSARSKHLDEVRAEVASALASLPDDAATLASEAVRTALSDRFVMVKPRCKIPSNSRVARDLVQRSAKAGGAAPEAASASIKLFDAAILEPLRALRGEIMSHLDELGFKSPGGLYIVHAKHSLALAQKGRDWEAAYSKAAHTFLTQYTQACEDWKDLLGNDYNPDVYPTLDKLRKSMGLDPGALQKGFQLEIAPIGGLADQYTLDASAEERDYLERSLRANFDTMVGRSLASIHQSLEAIAGTQEKGKRLSKATLARVRTEANKLRVNGLVTDSTDAALTAIEAAVAVDMPTKKRDRAAAVANISAVASDLGALLQSNEDDA